MGKGLFVILIIITIIGIVTYVQHGTEEIKNAPIESIWDSTQSIADAGKKGYEKGIEGVEKTVKIIEIIKKERINGTLIGVCNIDEDCKQFPQCVDKVCYCIAELCYEATN